MRAGLDTLEVTLMGHWGREQGLRPGAHSSGELGAGTIEADVGCFSTSLPPNEA